MGVVTRGARPGGSLTRGMQGPHSTAKYGGNREKSIWDVASDAKKVGKGKKGMPLNDPLLAHGCRPTQGGAVAANNITTAQWKRPPPVGLRPR